MTLTNFNVGHLLSYHENLLFRIYKVKKRLSNAEFLVYYNHPSFSVWLKMLKPRMNGGRGGGDSETP